MSDDSFQEFTRKGSAADAATGAPQPVDARFVQEVFAQLSNAQIVRMVGGDAGLYLQEKSQSILYLETKELRAAQPEEFAKLTKNEIDVVRALDQAEFARKTPQEQLDRASKLQSQAKAENLVAFERSLLPARVLSAAPRPLDPQIHPDQRRGPMLGTITSVTKTNIHFIDEDRVARQLLRSLCADDHKLKAGDEVEFNFKGGKATPTVVQAFIPAADRRLINSVEPGVMRISADESRRSGWPAHKPPSRSVGR